MNRLLNSLATLAVLLHMLCGCCWHHAHDQGADRHGRLPAAVVSCPHCEHGPTACAEGDRHSGHDRTACNELSCDFVRTESDAAMQAWSQGHLDARAPAEILPADGPALPTAAPAVAGPRRSLRLHLVIQKLLV